MRGDAHSPPRAPQRFQNLSRWRAAGRGPARHLPHRGSGNHHGAPGPQRLRQDDPAEPCGRDGLSFGGRSPDRRPRHFVAVGIRSDGAAPHAGGLRLPVLPTARRRSPFWRMSNCRCCWPARRKPPRRRATGCAGSGWKTRPPACRTSSRAGRCSASRSPARWSIRPTC